MPKIVDHDERRKDIASAVLRIIARDGIRGADIRSVAGEAGWSTGVISHYFGDKQGLLAGALREASEDVAGRMRAIGKRRSGHARLIGLLEAGMPLDEERRALCRIFYHFSSEGMSDPQFAAELAAYYRAWRDGVADAIRDIQSDGGFRGQAADALSVTLVSLAEGLGVQGLFDSDALPPRHLRARLDEAVGCLMRCAEAKPRRVRND